MKFSFLRFLFLTELYPIFSCEKTLLIITHERQGTFKFPHRILNFVMINKRARLSRLEKIFITEDLTDAQIGVTPDSFFCGRQVE